MGLALKCINVRPHGITKLITILAFNYRDILRYHKIQNKYLCTLWSKKYLLIVPDRVVNANVRVVYA